jgi:hypothetical protein
VKVGVLFVAVSSHLAGDGPAAVLLDVDPQPIDAAIATAAVRMRGARVMVMVLLGRQEQYPGQPRAGGALRLQRAARKMRMC